MNMKIVSGVKEGLKRQNLWVLSVFFVCLLAGLIVFNDYGASWDENIMQVYADQSLKNYVEWREQGEIKIEHETLQYYGPFFMMTVQTVSRFLDGISQANIADLRHLVYFLVYFAGIVAFYTIARRWFDPIPSIGATLLYALQPLLWGHAFINPKDAPFMSMMVISIAAGLKMVDAIHALPDSEFSSTKPRVWAVSLLWLASVVVLFLSTQAAHNLIAELVVSAKAGGTNIISMLATKLNQVPAKVYIERYFVLFLRARAVYAALSFAFILYFWRRAKPILLKILVIVFAPALLLGFTTSTRVLGPFAGVIVAYFLLRNKSRISFMAALIYALVAVTAAYLTWPFLWMNPAGNLFASIQKMSAFPWAGDVLFNGNFYKASDIPFAYLPTLLLYQMTEPVWALVLPGLGISFLSNQRKPDLVVLFSLWFLLPFLYLFLGNAILFDNFRHVLFILPSVFLMAGNVFEWIPKTGWRIAVIVLCILPGIFGIISLHPYEYAYYNQFIGGLHGAHGRFETEYWLTSYREAAEYINKNASPGAGVWVEGPGHVFSPYAREDLKVNSWSSESPVDGYEYVVTSYRFIRNETTRLDAEIAYEIIRDNTVLAVIKKP
ncbi:MAG: hypothetical protein C4557_05085 [Anaerolineaceae bacterium]|jgi:hypothetical protein|nr:MAG: hypothetical protein C4557_05085 [Anaerolineaceae bacterium]